MRPPLCQLFRVIPSSMTSNDLWRPLGIKRRGRSGWKPLLLWLVLYPRSIDLIEGSVIPLSPPLPPLRLRVLA